MAKHIADNLERSANLPYPSKNDNSAPVVDRLRAICEVPLGLASAGILRDRLINVSFGDVGRGTQALVSISKQKIRECAARGDFSIFSPWFRYLGHNLEAMGLLSYSDRVKIDPWCCPEVDGIVRGPSRLPGYKMVLVPPPAQTTLPTNLERDGCTNMAPGLDSPFPDRVCSNKRRLLQLC